MNYHLIVEIPLGYCGLVFSQKPFLLHNVLMPKKSVEDIKAKLQEYGKPSKNNIAERIALCIKDYFDGFPISIPWHLLDLHKLTDFEQKVLHSTSEIPFGEVRSYKKIAVNAGKPNASRAAGNALAKNPFPIIIPCHRVVKQDGTIGNYGGGTEMKKIMLELERAKSLQI